MSDTGRMSLSDKAHAKLKPDSEKSTTEHMTDKFHGKADNTAARAQPEGEKTYTQKIGDKFSTGKSGPDNDDRSFVDKTKDTLGLGHKGS
ncbi:heat shock protein 9/12-domain-containing protein [Vararia minispora EC-137]|uniref:Heat shock protein 9/12-domain-containing protein n=1 Tax=Vararia minispora EC-137 TaxID=1314806 RepID=A0ACB8Q7T3_9AGAM|nr:heat shock protein 9/12-domain-containing protein [Vararia minispora EC-137]